MEEETDQGSDYGEEIIGRNNLEVGIIDFCPENETAYQHVWRRNQRLLSKFLPYGDWRHAVVRRSADLSIAYYKTALHNTK
jgi:hypothetical protein